MTTKKAGAALRAPTPGQTKNHSQDKYIHSADGRQVLGVARGAFFVKTVVASKHLLRKPRPAWALDVGALKQARALGCTDAEMREGETGTTYRASFEQVERLGFVVDRGFGPQIALELRYWVIFPKNAPKSAASRQMALAI
jgi:hypothetical protein